MFSSRWYPYLLVAVLFALAGGATLIERLAIDHLLHDDAVSTGRNWADYLVRNVDDLTAIAAGKEPSAASRAVFAEAKKVGQIFLYKIYDAEGVVRFASDDLPQSPGDKKTLSAHNAEAAEAAEAVEAGKPMAAARTGTPPSRPPYFSEAYVPVLSNGQVTAVVETYVDQTEKRTQFQRAFFGTAISISLLIAAAFGGPAAAWYFRDRDKQQADEHIRFLGNHDALTGLANRTQLGEVLTRTLAQFPAEHQRLAVHCVDMDRFQDVNDTLGHAAGDVMIKTVADRLRSLAGPDNLVARLSADEFVVLQMNPLDRTAAEGFAARIVQMIAEPVWLEGQEVRVTACVGVALAPEHGMDAIRLMKSADLALSKSKSSGRGQVRVFASVLDTELSQRLTLERAIDRAVENDGFLLHYQPQFRLKDDRLVGFEALLRLPTPQGGFIPPTIFIPVAEGMGLIGRIGEFVLKQACGIAATWPEHLTVSVNLSPSQFASGEVGAIVARALKESGLKPQRLELEITESLLITQTAATMSELAGLKALGVSVAMDDFGTGYSSLSYLWQFPFDKIKIDRVFINAFAAGDAAAEKIIRTIVGLSRSLNMRVTVEGVETAEQAAFVRAIGCDEVQGFFFGRPAPTADLAAIILADHRRSLRPDEGPTEAKLSAFG
jgi:diguanylate cyclase (GGDEF)-like protein